ncbi:MAG: hypothetical protein WC450_02950 [Candidatus Omnitrophota bacterium]|jgi:hypothetical protein
MKCFRCSKIIDLPGDAGLTWKFVVANNTYHSSQTVHPSISYSSTFTFDQYLKIAHEEVVLCADCLNKRRKLQRNCIIIGVALFLPFLITAIVMAGKTVDTFSKVDLSFGVIGLLTAITGGMGFDESEFNGRASNYVINRYVAMGYPNVALFSESRWEEIVKKNGG